MQYRDSSFYIKHLDFSNKDKDIHALKLGKSKLHDIDDMFYGSFGYWTSLLVPLALLAEAEKELNLILNRLFD